MEVIPARQSPADSSNIPATRVMNSATPSRGPAFPAA